MRSCFGTPSPMAAPIRCRSMPACRWHAASNISPAAGSASGGTSAEGEPRLGRTMQPLLEGPDRRWHRLKMADLHPMLAHAFQLSAAGRNAEGMLIVNQLAAQGDPEALWILADANWRGNMMPVNYVRGRELIARASDAGHPIATRAFTNLLASGIAGPRDWQRALSRLAQEARGDRLRARMLSLIRHMDLDEQGDPRTPPQGQVLSESPHVMLFPRLFSPG